MRPQRRWDPCISHRRGEADKFIDDYFDCADRKVLFIAGAGFDPRATIVAKKLAKTRAEVHAVLIRESRPNPTADLLSRAETNLTELRRALKACVELTVDIFGTDSAVVGGRKVVSGLREFPLDLFTDVIVDVSALSVGTAFPVVRDLVNLVEGRGGKPNLHLFVLHDPALDCSIRATPSDQPGYVHGFRGEASLDGTSGATRLWLPHLAPGKVQSLNTLYDFVVPHDTCPVIAFPSEDPRLGDRLAQEFLAEFESGWPVDTRNIVYADEEDPLDLYRTILRIDDLREPVFREVGGSLLILSPVGSKVLALGSLMAALERNLPVAYLESIGYSLGSSVPATTADPDVVHIWLEGDAYPQPRPPLNTKGSL
jgi:hypothetical protein